MIYYNIHSEAKNWLRRVKKIKEIINKILLYKKNLKFLNNTYYYCNFVLANDKYLKKLNRKYKKNNKSTDVLTFVTKFNNKQSKMRYCDIFLSIETISKDAKKNEIIFYDHLTHLIIHSLLHINGYAHNNNKNYMLMKKIEINILKKLGIENPY